MSTEYRRRPEKQPEVRQFFNRGTHRLNMIEGHELAAWAHAQGEGSSEGRVSFVSVHRADNGMAPEGVHVRGRNERDRALFTVNPGDFLVWENDEFRVYSAEEFGKVFEPLPTKRGGYDPAAALASGLDMRPGEPFLAGRSNQ